MCPYYLTAHPLFVGIEGEHASTRAISQFHFHRAVRLMREFRAHCPEEHFIAVITACLDLLENFAADPLIGVLGRTITLEDIDADHSARLPPDTPYSMP